MNMKRTKGGNAGELPWWIKEGGGTFTMTDHNGKRRIIKQGQKFQAAIEDIPQGFLDVIKPLSGQTVSKSAKGEPTGAPPAPKDVAGGDYTLKRRSPNSPWYDVFDAQGKKVNEKALKHDDAMALIDSLK